MPDLTLAIRPPLRPLVVTPRRFAVGVAHRRAGKTVAAVQRLVLSALNCPLPNPHCSYIAPTFGQAKRAAWDYLKLIAAPVQAGRPHETELRVTLLNGGRIQLFGAENADALRGDYNDDVVIDEYADMKPSVFPLVVRPSLSDRGGRALFIGTPKGRNQFYEIWRDAAEDADWERLMLKASETGILPAEELAAARKRLTAEQYEQEYECSFDAAIQGAYYARELAAAAQAGRIGRVPWEPAVPVETWWDLGIDDATAIWFAQAIGREVRLIDYYEAAGAGLDHYAKVLRERAYVYGRHVLPHDARVRELGTGRSRVETLASLGLRATLARQQTVEDGINAVRLLLPRCWFDERACRRGIEALRQYRSDWDERRQTLRPVPLHDWTSHAADAFRYGAVTRRPAGPPAPPPVAATGYSPLDWRGGPSEAEIAYDPFGRG